MKIIRKPKKNKNYLATIAIGEKYFNDWYNFALPNWIKYCENNDIGIIAVTDDLISKNDQYWKKATWQKLLLGSKIKEKGIDIENVCYLDSDILANPFAPDIFFNYDEESIAVVSQKKNLEQPLNETLRRLAFLRNKHYSKDYPLDSALFMSAEEVFEYHNLPKKNDYFCAGLFIFNLKNHSDLMKTWFYKYTKDIDTLTGGGDEPILNYEFLNYEKVSWLNYKFQAIWIYEIAWKYPFLYDYGRDDKALIKECIEASLTTNYFLHFAGSWHESNMWKIPNFFNSDEKKNNLKEYIGYLNTSLKAKPVGLIKPK